MIEEQRSAGAGICCVFQRGCLLESYDLAHAAVMGAHASYCLLCKVSSSSLLCCLCLTCCGQSEACIVCCAESKGCLVCCAESKGCLVCCAESKGCLVCCAGREQGLSSVLCSSVYYQPNSSRRCHPQGPKTCFKGMDNGHVRIARKSILFEQKT
jgi:hypothetical protein